jgi:hypothetical protein
VPPPLRCTPSETYTAHLPLATLPYPVPGRNQNGGDVTVCFTFVRPEGAAAQAVAWGPVVGDLRVIHHISLFATADPIQDGAVTPCQFKDATYLMGWEPGRGNIELPSDIGLELPSKGSRGMILEVHYHNGADLKAVDGSGMSICTAESPRPFTAGVLTLGTEDIWIPPRGYAEAWGVCSSSVTSELSEPLHVLSTAPHMHNTGLSLETDVIHPDGSSTNLAPPQQWDPHSPGFFPHDPPVEIRPGDILKTVCKYRNKNDLPVVFGARAENEMCYSYNLVYPVSALPPSVDQAPLRLCDSH